MKVIGIDPSLTSTGVAVITSTSPGAHTAALRTTGNRDDPPHVTDARLDRITGFVAEYAALADLAVIEGPSHGSRGGSPWDRAGLWWRIVRRLLRADVAVAVCPPSSRAKWATGVGSGPRATKPLVAVAVAKLWPDVDAGSDDELDALAMATMGAQRLGLDVPHRSHHDAALRGVTWPDLAAEGAA